MLGEHFSGNPGRPLDVRDPLLLRHLTASEHGSDAAEFKGLEHGSLPLRETPTLIAPQDAWAQSPIKALQSKAQGALLPAESGFLREPGLRRH